MAKFFGTIKDIFWVVAYTLVFITVAVVFFKFVAAAVLLAMLLLWLRTWQMKSEPNQREFLRGKLPNPKPDGFYQGSTGFNTSWLGKKFDAQNSAGINVLKGKHGQRLEKYPFKTSAGNGLFDKNIFVLKIDYNVKGNPFWIHWILDEIVEIAPGQYLGKMHWRIVPGFPFSVLYFELRRQ